MEIYVPKSHQWFDFGGTMHQTEDEADLKAGRLAAFNKQGQRLIEASPRQGRLRPHARHREPQKLGRRGPEEPERRPAAATSVTPSLKASSPKTPA